MLDFFGEAINHNNYKDDTETFMALRMYADAAIEQFIKQHVLDGHIDQLKDIFGIGFDTDAFASAVEQAEALRSCEGIWTDGVTALPKGYAPAPLSAEILADLPSERRVAIALGLLDILEQLEAAEIYPGPLPMDAVIYDQSGTCGGVYIKDTVRFQLGCLRYTWTQYTSEDMDLSLTYPFFNRELQRVAGARLAAALLKGCPFGAKLRQRLAEETVYSFAETAAIIKDCAGQPTDSTAAYTAVGGEEHEPPDICVLTAPCSIPDHAKQYIGQIASINAAVAEAVGSSGKQVHMAYVWCGRECDSIGGMGKVNVRKWQCFDKDYIPHLPFPDLRDFRQMSPDRYFKNAYIAAETMLRLSQRRRKLLLILQPAISPASFEWVTKQAQKWQDANAAEVIYCHEGGPAALFDKINRAINDPSFC